MEMYCRRLTVEVSITNMTDYAAQEAALSNLFLGLFDDLRQFGNGDCNVCCPDTHVGVAASLGHDAPQGFFACLPQILLFLF